jgi:hypothetical protein
MRTIRKASVGAIQLTSYSTRQSQYSQSQMVLNPLRQLHNKGVGHNIRAAKHSRYDMSDKQRGAANAAHLAVRR